MGGGEARDLAEAEWARGAPIHPGKEIGQPAHAKRPTEGWTRGSAGRRRLEDGGAEAATGDPRERQRRPRADDTVFAQPHGALKAADTLLEALPIAGGHRRRQA